MRTKIIKPLIYNKSDKRIPLPYTIKVWRSFSPQKCFSVIQVREYRFSTHTHLSSNGSHSRTVSEFYVLCPCGREYLVKDGAVGSLKIRAGQCPRCHKFLRIKEDTIFVSHYKGDDIGETFYEYKEDLLLKKCSSKEILLRD